MEEDLARFAGSLAASGATTWTPAPRLPEAAIPSTRPVPIGGIVAVLAGLGLAVSAWLPWFTVSAAGLTATRNGQQQGLHGGMVTLLGAAIVVVGVLIGLTGQPRSSWLAVMLLGLVAAGVAGWQMSRVGDVASKVNAVFDGHALPGFDLHAGVGWGLWVALIVGLLAAAAGVAASLDR